MLGEKNGVMGQCTMTKLPLDKNFVEEINQILYDLKCVILIFHTNLSIDPSLFYFLWSPVFYLYHTVTLYCHRDGAPSYPERQTIINFTNYTPSQTTYSSQNGFTNARHRRNVPQRTARDSKYTFIYSNQ